MILAICFSGLVLGGLQFGAAFREEIEIVNQSGSPIWVTPVGVWHGSKTRSALPVTASRLIHWPALKNGGFAIAPGQSLRIDFDGDDIDLTEIYINAGPATVLEQSVKGRSAPDFDFDRDRRIEIGELARLPAASAPVTAAALGANKNGWQVAWVCLLVFGPLGISAGLWMMIKIFDKPAEQASEVAKKR